MAGAGTSSPIFGVQFPSLPPGFLPVTPLTTRLHLHQSLEGGRSFTKPEGRLCKTMPIPQWPRKQAVGPDNICSEATLSCPQVTHRKLLKWGRL